MTALMMFHGHEQKSGRPAEGEKKVDDERDNPHVGVHRTVCVQGITARPEEVAFDHGLNEDC